MSHNNRVQDGSIATGRPKRNIKLTHKAEEILQTGEGIPGILSPNERTEEYFSQTNLSSVSSMAGTLTDSERIRGKRTQSPTFAPDKFAIYHWEIPRPRDFLNLSESRKAWKRRTDEQEKATDIDDGSDDWEEYADDRDKHCVGRTFVNRAKRAFWRGKTWEEFEDQERRIDSEARTASGPATPYQLDNAFRLEVFDSLKRRLCEEIWLEPYKDPPGLVRLPIPRSDSPMASAGGADAKRFVAGTGGRLLEPSEEEAERGVVSWSRNSDREWEPRYQDEQLGAPGMSNFLQHWRTREQREPGSSSAVSRVGEDGRRERTGNIGVAGPVRMTATEEIARRGTDFETSDEGEE